MHEDNQQHHRSQSYYDLKQKKMHYVVKPDVIALTNNSKYLYPNFNIFQLQVNRLSALPQYQAIANEILAFNVELDNWKLKNIDIKNLLVTYHLYQNLFSRMKYTSSLIVDRNEARKKYVEIFKWFQEEKPRIRNKAPQKEEGQLRPSTHCETEDESDRFLVTSATKRQLRVYQSMSRTTHAEFFPPKERLIQYRRKELIQERGKQLTQRRALSVNNLNKMQKYRKSFASTRATFKQTVVTELNRQPSKIEPVIIPFELKLSIPQFSQQIKQQQPQTEEDPLILDDLQRERKVAQQEILQQNIVNPVHEQDIPDGEEQQEEEKPQKKIIKKYAQDNADEEMIAEENMKDAKQSTLRRILNNKGEIVRSKMEEIKIAEQMRNWAATKGRMNSENLSKYQRINQVNRYDDLKYMPKTFQERQSARKRDIPQYAMLYRNNSVQPEYNSIQNDVERLKIKSALKTYGKFINNHIEVRPIVSQNQEQRQQMRIMRSTSLTSFGRQCKKLPFSKIIEIQSERFNEDAQDHTADIKQRLAKNTISVENKQILNGLVAIREKITTDVKIFPPEKRLFSNPFFPKHLYTTKPKKKKN